MRRRTFFSSAAAAASLAASSSLQSAPVKPGDIPMRVLGKTGEKITIIGQAGGDSP